MGSTRVSSNLTAVAAYYNIFFFCVETSLYKQNIFRIITSGYDEAVPPHQATQANDQKLKKIDLCAWLQ